MKYYIELFYLYICVHPIRYIKLKVNGILWTGFDKLPNHIKNFKKTQHKFHFQANDWSYNFYVKSTVDILLLLLQYLLYSLWIKSRHFSDSTFKFKYFNLYSTIQNCVPTPIYNSIIFVITNVIKITHIWFK